jgi:DNA-binding NtrC family response regulator
MTGAILISTHRLPLAGRLRESFAAKGFDVDLVADPAELKVPSDARLLVLTGETPDSPVKRWIDEARASLEIPVFTALPGADAITRGRELGAEEAFGSNPDPDEVVLLAIRTVDRRRLQQVTGIVGEAEAMREALERVVQIAPVDSTVLITGESGTGKELVARGIHALSPRRHRAFMAVNVAALPDTLLESELFGHEKGAFTGAIDARKGFFELADRGTLFLDEIGEMPLSTQTKLLRVIEQREFLRVGGEQPIRVDVRIIAATNQDLRSQVLEGRFRRDLFYRLNILDIELPPLRRRREDVPRLVNHFVRELTQRLDRPFPGITPEAMDLLVRYDWPGNVRELRNLVESMVVLAPRNPIGPKDVPREIRSPMEGRRLLPAPAAVAMQAAREVHPEVGESEARRIRPELEFVFRTLVELRVDMDQLRRDFEVYRDEVDGRVGFSGEVPLALPLGAGGDAELGTRPRPRGGPMGTVVSSADGPDGGGAIRPSEEEAVEPGVIVYQPGMTMDAMEEQAIRAALEEMDGNRRKAAESLGIGERTLYRKIQKYGIDE